VTNHHHWFRSGSYSLLGHLDMPDEQPARSGVVIVPPFGWEDICSYRSLRSLARSLASRGIAVLRFDLPGTGDSSGSALDSDLFPAWIRSVQEALAKLKAVSGVQSVSVLGIRLGAMLALAAVSTGTPIKKLILWGASAKGHAVVRELRAFRNLEVTEHAEVEAPPALSAYGVSMLRDFSSTAKPKTLLKSLMRSTFRRCRIKAFYCSRVTIFRMTAGLSSVSNKAVPG
jgi:pimeloyl-ACP methyl ester carboxylesterase